MAVYVLSTVLNFTLCAENRVLLQKISNPIELFPASEPLTNVVINILGRLTKLTSVNHFILVVVGRFTKLNIEVPLRRIKSLTVSNAFLMNFFFKFGVLKQVLPFICSQFASKFFLGDFQMLGIQNSFTSAYKTQTNLETEPLNRTILQILLFYVSNHHRDWDTYLLTHPHIFLQHGYSQEHGVRSFRAGFNKRTSGVLHSRREKPKA